ncbi:MAG: serine/threonine protein kinase [Clostridia bacterium]|nr:serine/threonine protein kinase [Clostridia bacterium]
MNELIDIIENQLLNEINLKSVNRYDPIVVESVPEDWVLMGNGNYAAVVYHRNYPDYAVKIYAEGREGIEEEKIVYEKLGKHKSFSECYHYGNNYLVLKRLKGTTLYDCLKKGIPIPEKVIKDIDNALDYAKSRGLYPHDIHFKNVMMNDGRGLIVDISDFLKKEYCPLWHDCKKFYYKVYKRLPFIIPLPDFFLNMGRKTYRFYKKAKKKF